MSVILLTCTIVLVLICTGYILLEYSSSKDILKNKVSTVGAVVASNSSAALAFDSEHDAIEILSALEGDSHIVAAALYDKDGNLLPPTRRISRPVPCRPGRVLTGMFSGMITWSVSNRSSRPGTGWEPCSSNPTWRPSIHSSRTS